MSAVAVPRTDTPLPVPWFLMPVWPAKGTAGSGTAVAWFLMPAWQAKGTTG
jgi:hypothetical protein